MRRSGADRRGEFARYFALLEKEPDTLWGVHFPDVSDCVAAAEAANVALADPELARADVLQDMLGEDRALPSPRSIEELQAGAAVRAALQSSAALAAVPFCIVKAAE